MDSAQSATVWLARLSAACYVVALFLMARRAHNGARLAWTTGAVAMVLHVAGVFQFFHSWSHTIAYRETERQTLHLFCIRWGGGLYLNYLLVVAWLADSVWWWRWPAGYASRPRWLSASIHTYLAFMFLNATVAVWILRAINGT